MEKVPRKLKYPKLISVSKKVVTVKIEMIDLKNRNKIIELYYTLFNVFKLSLLTLAGSLKLNKKICTIKK